MVQVFHRSTNTISKVSILGAALSAVGALFVFNVVIRSPYATQVAVVKEQPVQFSHEHHVRGLGIDCRYCHTSVEQSSFAGVPPTYTCMSCHSQIWNDSPMLAPVRESLRDDRPIRWNRVHDLPDFVYFNHAIHVNKGIGCVSCHGRVDKMPLTWKEEPLTMEWCLECHRHPERQIRPKERVFNLEDWVPEDGRDRVEAGRELVKRYAIEAPHKLTNCDICHR